MQTAGAVFVLEKSDAELAPFFKRGVERVEMIGAAAGLAECGGLPMPSGKHGSLMFVSDQLSAPWTLVSRRFSHTLIIPSGRVFIERGRVVLNPLPP